MPHHKQSSWWRAIAVPATKMLKAIETAADCTWWTFGQLLRAVAFVQVVLGEDCLSGDRTREESVRQTLSGHNASIAGAQARDQIG